MPAIRNNAHRSRDRAFAATEDVLLLCLVADHGVCWARILPHFPDRTKSSLRNRWSRLLHSSMARSKLHRAWARDVCSESAELAALVPDATYCL